ncbi:MAG: phage major capsid protein [Sphaerochaeta sp.]|jgi:HK97 family phage major capsid protein|nr:phage major capsid protein [Sphaerochaeta sp.]
MAEIKEEIMQVLTQMRTEHKAAVDEAIKNGATISGEAKANVEKMNKRIDELELKLQKQAIVLPGSEPGKKTEEQIARTKAFYQYVRYGKAGLEPAERKALVEDASGLIMVPEDLDAEISRALPRINSMRNICDVKSTTRDKKRRRTLSEVTMGWGKLETGALVPESNMVPTEDYIYVEDLTGLAKIGKDELMDTDANLQAELADSFATAKADKEDTAFAVGSGHTVEEPDGIAVDAVLRASLESGCGAGDEATYGISWTTDDTVLINDILKAEYKLPTQYLNGASWLMNRKTELAARVLQAAGTGQYLWQPSLQVGQPNQFDGFPLYNNNDMAYPADTTAATNVVFGNFKRGYLIVDRMGMAIQRLDELYAEAGLVGFMVHFRVGGGLKRYDPFIIIVNDV